jgi:hypothetical protein
MEPEAEYKREHIIATCSRRKLMSEIAEPGLLLRSQSVGDLDVDRNLMIAEA